MPGFVTNWIRRTFYDPQVVILLAVLIGTFLVLALIGDVLAPLIAGLVIAYLLDGAVSVLVRTGLPRTAAAALVAVLFLAALLGLFIVLVPLLLGQLAQVSRLLPSLITGAQEFLLRLPEAYPDLFDAQQVQEVVRRLRADVLEVGQRLLVYSVTRLPDVVTLVIYVVLLPTLVFFLLKDKHRILYWVLGYLPPHRPLADRVWREVDAKTGRYVRGKIYEILIVGGASYVVFLALDLRLSALLAALSGLSVLVPFVGAPVAGIPVALIAYTQWGLGPEFAWAVLAYTVIQILDGFVLNPVLLGGVVRLHPIAIIAAILVFGDIWGFWGVFFAVPLASLVQSVLGAWPRAKREAAADQIKATPEENVPEPAPAARHRR